MGSTYIDVFFSLPENERTIVKAAVRSGDTPMSQQLVQLYFPKVPSGEIPKLIAELKRIAS